MINNHLPYLLLRLGIGISLFGHGLVRLPKLHGFSKWMTGHFENSMLPQALVLSFSYALPVVEFVIGLLLITGLFTRGALIAGSIVMLLLILGSCLIEEWSALPAQLIHLLFLAGLLSFIHLNSFAGDQLFNKKQ